MTRRIVEVLPLGPSLIFHRHETDKSDEKIIGPNLIGPVRIELITLPYASGAPHLYHVEVHKQLPLSWPFKPPPYPRQALQPPLHPEQGYLAHKKQRPVGPYSRTMPRTLWGS